MGKVIIKLLNLCEAEFPTGFDVQDEEQFQREREAWLAGVAASEQQEFSKLRFDGAFELSKTTLAKKIRRHSTAESIRESTNVRNEFSSGRTTYALTDNLKKLLESKIERSDDQKIGRVSQVISALKNKFHISELQSCRILQTVCQGEVALPFTVGSVSGVVLNELLDCFAKVKFEERSFQLTKTGGNKLYIDLSDVSIVEKKLDSVDPSEIEIEIGRANLVIEFVPVDANGGIDFVPKIIKLDFELTDEVMKKKALEFVAKNRGMVRTDYNGDTYLEFLPVVAADPEDQLKYDAKQEVDYAIARNLLAEEDRRAVSNRLFLSGGESRHERVEKALRYSSQKVLYRLDSNPKPFVFQTKERTQEKEYEHQCSENWRAADSNAGTNFYVVIDGVKQKIADIELRPQPQNGDESDQKGLLLMQKINAFVDKLPLRYHTLETKLWIACALQDTTQLDLMARVSAQSEGTYMLLGVKDSSPEFTLFFNEKENRLCVESTQSSMSFYLPNDDLTNPRPPLLHTETSYYFSIPSNSEASAPTTEKSIRVWHDNATEEDHVPACEMLKQALTKSAESLNSHTKEDCKFKVSDQHVGSPFVQVNTGTLNKAYQVARQLDENLNKYLELPPLTWRNYFKRGGDRGISAARRERAKLLQAMARACTQQASDGKLTQADADAYLQTFYEFAAQHESDHSSWFNKTRRLNHCIKDALDKVGLSPEQKRAYTAQGAQRCVFTVSGSLSVANSLKEIGIGELRDDEALDNLSSDLFGSISYRDRYQDIATCRVKVGAELENGLVQGLTGLVASSSPQVTEDDYSSYMASLEAVAKNPAFGVSKEKIDQYKKDVVGQLFVTRAEADSEKVSLSLSVLLNKIKNDSKDNYREIQTLILEFHSKLEKQKAWFKPSQVQQFKEGLFSLLEEQKEYWLGSYKAAESFEVEAKAKAQTKAQNALVGLQMLAKGIFSYEQQDKFINDINMQLKNLVTSVKLEDVFNEEDFLGELRKKMLEAADSSDVMSVWDRIVGLMQKGSDSDKVVDSLKIFIVNNFRQINDAFWAVKKEALDKVEVLVAANSTADLFVGLERLQDQYVFLCDLAGCLERVQLFDKDINLAKNKCAARLSLRVGMFSSPPSPARLASQEELHDGLQLLTPPTTKLVS